MRLPDLPMVLHKREAHWTTTIFRKWCEKNCKNPATVFEVKYAIGNSLPFSAVKSGQIAKMLTIRHDTFVWKNPDTGEETPPDIFVFHQAPTYIVIKYPKMVAIIPIDVFVMESKRSKRRSLTWERGKELSTIEFK